jgi:hypothetical protein
MLFLARELTALDPRRSPAWAGTASPMGGVSKTKETGSDQETSSVLSGKALLQRRSDSDFYANASFSPVRNCNAICSAAVIEPLPSDRRHSRTRSRKGKTMFNRWSVPSRCFHSRCRPTLCGSTINDDVHRGHIRKFLADRPPHCEDGERHDGAHSRGDSRRALLEAVKGRRLRQRACRAVARPLQWRKKPKAPDVIKALAEDAKESQP